VIVKYNTNKTFLLFICSYDKRLRGGYYYGRRARKQHRARKGGRRNEALQKGNVLLYGGDT
jgi:hypothetical protein